MRELIGEWAAHIGLVAMLIATTSWTIEAAAKNHGISAAIFSPIALIFWLVVIVLLAEYFGWIGDKS